MDSAHGAATSVAEKDNTVIQNATEVASPKEAILSGAATSVAEKQ